MPYTPEELAKSYINGNISTVRGHLKGKSKLSLLTGQIVQEFYGQKEYNTFIRLMTN